MILRDEPVHATAAGLPAAVALRRDRLTWTGYGTLATWGWFLYGFGAVLPLLRAEQGTSRTVMGLHSLALSAGSVLAGLAMDPLVRRLRRRDLLRLGAALACAGAGLLALAPAPSASLPATLVAGLGGALMINTANPALSDHHGRAGAAALSEGNAVAAVVGLVAPLAVGIAVGAGLTWRPALLLVVVLAAGLVALVRRTPDTPALDSGGRSAPAPRTPAARLPRRFWVLALVVVVSVGIEFACTAWSADLLRQRTDLSAGAASAGVSAVVGGMATGRFVAVRLARRFSPQALLVSAYAVTAVGWAVTWTATSGAPALAGLALLGLGISAHYPLGAALVFVAAGTRSDRASAVLSLGIGFSSALVPLALGVVADATSTHTAFVAVPVLAATAVSLLLVTIVRGRVQAG